MTEHPMDHADMTPAPGPRERVPVSGRRLDDMTPRGAVPAVRCRATNRQGHPCGRWAIIGGDVCTSHGGASPQHQATAAARIRELTAPALTVVERMLTDPETPPAVLQRLVADILDRSGHKAADVVVNLNEQVERRDLGDAMAKVMRERGLMPTIDVEPVDEG